MDQPTAEQQIAELSHGYWKSQAVYVAAKLGIADLLSERSRTVEELAEVTPAHAPSLYRVMRALASIGIFAEGEDGRFSMTPLAEPLRRDVPGSKWAMAVMMGEEGFHVWGDLIFTVETGQTAFDRIYGMPIFEFLSENDEMGRIFDEAMTGIHGQETNAILDAYDFTAINTLADIGGGNGTKLIAALEKYPSMKGILFDLPPVVKRARKQVEATGVRRMEDSAQAGLLRGTTAGGAVQAETRGDHGGVGRFLSELISLLIKRHRGRLFRVKHGIAPFAQRTNTSPER